MSADYDKLSEVCSKNYKEQAIWFLNAFWDEFSGEAEKIWGFVHTMAELDHQKKAEGSALDELQAHRFLEKYNETLTVQSMRDKLRSTGAITTSVKLVPLLHILIFKYNVDWHFMVNAPQGNKDEIAKAQAMLDEVQAAFFASEARAEESRQAYQAAAAREREAKQKEQEAREQEAPFKAAQEEVDAALAEVNSQEESRRLRTEELERKSKEGGVVQQNKAKAELAQHLAEDPLPLRKAKITLEAALKKAEKARAPFEAATKQAEQARAAAEEAAREAERAKAAAEEALAEATRRLEEAEAYLEEAKNRLPQGQIWWLDRELQERRKYLPKAKGGIDK
ncbi:Merozoite surface protein 3a [Balamuthia mandrillaris]